ncbi:MAG: major facilitator superfamily 1 [Holophagaceae bacterium]|nr:major facilitator superfamily 1 [Holophagaceae bacterium]
MSIDNTAIAANPGKSGTGFGSYGWGMIIFSMLMYFAYAGWVADGINIFTPAFASRNGWDQAKLLSLVAPGGLMGVVGAGFFGQLVVKKGPRFVLTLCLVCSAASVIWFGRISSLAEFALSFMAINFFASGFGFIAPGTLMNNWFPRKKGMALAVATTGFPLATAVFVPLIALMFNRLGITLATSVWGVIFLAAAVLGFLVVKDNPEQIGCYPDNDPTEERASVEDLDSYVSPFTVKRLLKDRDMWLISFGWGCLWMVTMGIVVQLVPRLMSIGYSQQSSIALLSAAAVCAIPGGLLWGWLDQKFGTKTASFIYGVLYIITLFLLIYQTKNYALTFMTVVFVGIGLGGIKNLLTSMVSTVYGRFDFGSAYRLVVPISLIVRTLAFLIMGIALAVFKSLSGAYAMFIVVDIIALGLIVLTRGTCKGKTH